LQLLEEGYTHPESHILITLKDEPRYKALMRKINFPGLTDGSPTASPAIEKSPLQASY